jgi:hypothetical protein
MTTAKPIARPLLLGLVILAALAVYAASSLSVSLGSIHPSIVLPQRSQTDNRPNNGNAQGQSTQGPESSQPSQSSAQGAQQPSTSGTGGAAGAGSGVTRFADAGPDVVAPTMTQSVKSCGPKPCPRPAR